ncbi:heme exporter protein CcmD [Pelagibacteraceae bacterium]|nr:heme exporter protein CcmD [Pelagibacteraceae bacterium]
MYFDFLILGGYGYFVWPSFAFALGSLFFLLFQSKKEFNKYEKRFLDEFPRTEMIQIKTVKRKDISPKPASPIF